MHRYPLSITSAFTEPSWIGTRRLTLTEEERPKLQPGETRSNETSNNRNEGWWEARSYRKGSERREREGQEQPKQGVWVGGRNSVKRQGQQKRQQPHGGESWGKKEVRPGTTKKGGARDQQPTGGGGRSNQRGEETRSNEEGNLFQRSQIEVHMNMCGIVCGVLPKYLFHPFLFRLELHVSGICFVCSQRISRFFGWWRRVRTCSKRTFAAVRERRAMNYQATFDHYKQNEFRPRRANPIHTQC